MQPIIYLSTYIQWSVCIYQLLPILNGSSPLLQNRSTLHCTILQVPCLLHQPAPDLFSGDKQDMNGIPFGGVPVSGSTSPNPDQVFPPIFPNHDNNFWLYLYPWHVTRCSGLQTLANEAFTRRNRQDIRRFVLLFLEGEVGVCSSCAKMYLSFLRERDSMCV